MEKPEPPDALEQITRLQHIMAALRDPQTGCPWDREQDFASIARYTIEEAYEVADAIRSASPDKLKEELGDLLCRLSFMPVWQRSWGSSRWLMSPPQFPRR